MCQQHLKKQKSHHDEFIFLTVLQKMGYCGKMLKQNIEEGDYHAKMNMMLLKIRSK